MTAISLTAREPIMPRRLREPELESPCEAHRVPESDVPVVVGGVVEDLQAVRPVVHQLEAPTDGGGCAAPVADGAHILEARVAAGQLDEQRPGIEVAAWRARAAQWPQTCARAEGDRLCRPRRIRLAHARIADRVRSDDVGARTRDESQGPAHELEPARAARPDPRQR